MATVNEKMTGLADAVRTKAGGTNKLSIDSMTAALNNIPNRTSDDLTVNSATVTVPAGNYKTTASKSVSTATRADTTMSVTADDINDKLTITASNSQGAGYTNGGNKTATTTITLSASGANVTASDGSKSVTKSVATATRAGTSIATAADSTNAKLTLTATNSQNTGYVTADTTKDTATKTITLTASGATVTATDNSSTPVKVSKSVTTATRASTSLSSSKDATNNTLIFTASNPQTTGYVTADMTKDTATKTVSISASGKTVTATDGSNSISATIDDKYVDTSSGNATAEDVCKGMKVWVDGKEIIGSIPIINYEREYLVADVMAEIVDEEYDEKLILLEANFLNNDIDEGRIIAEGNFYTGVYCSNFGFASPDCVLEGNSFSSSEGVKIEGTMPRKTSENLTVDGAKVIVPAGYYSIDTEKSIPETILPPPYFFLNTSTGIINATIDMDGEAGYIKGDAVSGGSYDIGAKVDPSIIKKGEKLFGKTGTYEGEGGDTSIKTCTVNITFAITPSERFKIFVRKYSNNIEYFEFIDVFSAKIVTIPNVVCGSALIIDLHNDASNIYWSENYGVGIAIDNMGVAAALDVPKTEGTYSVTVEMFDD